MNTFTFDGSWNQIKGVLRQRFAQLSDMDLQFIQGKGEELLGRLQTKLGLNREELERMLENIKNSAAAGAETAGALYDEGRRKVRGFYEIAEEEVRRRPREAVAAAFLAGFAIGLMLRPD